MVMENVPKKERDAVESKKEINHTETPQNKETIHHTEKKENHTEKKEQEKKNEARH